MNKKLLYELTDYEKIVLNINKLGDLIVMGILLIENEETNSKVQLTESTVRNALNLLQKRHPFFHAYINENSNLQINEQDYNLIELEWFDQDQLPNRSEMLTQLESFNTKTFDFPQIKLVWNIQTRILLHTVQTNNLPKRTYL